MTPIHTVCTYIYVKFKPRFRKSANRFKPRTSRGTVYGLGGYWLGKRIATIIIITGTSYMGCQRKRRQNSFSLTGPSTPGTKGLGYGSNVNGCELTKLLCIYVYIYMFVAVPTLDIHCTSMYMIGPSPVPPGRARGVVTVEPTTRALQLRRRLGIVMYTYTYCMYVCTGFAYGFVS